MSANPPLPQGQLLAEVYAGDERATVCLGGTLVATPRLALRWLRGQAERLANGSDPDPDAAPWIPPSVLRAVPLSVAGAPDVLDAPTELRAWAADDRRQDEALQRLVAGAEFEFIARDETCWYGLTARPLLIPEFMPGAGAGALIHA
ncbi:MULTISPECIES: hypothetical protein [unclassified Streptomyces]|uniref:hypothetical protein n=1 Tax=unclassified Streptomyces TaxID=2593676 RepID=UPI0036EF9FFD